MNRWLPWLLGLMLGITGTVQAAPDAAHKAVGEAYEKGDYVTVVKLLRPLAEKGDAKAQASLGVQYHKGQGVPQDYYEAVMWWRRAAEQGEATAQGLLGISYLKGEGVRKDYVLAHMWSNLAAAQGNEGAMKIRDILAKRMTPAQITAAQVQARNWTARFEREQKKRQRGATAP